MERINRGHRDAINRAFGLLPARLADRVRHTHFLTDTDAVFVGLHNYVKAGDNRYYASTPHCAWPIHQFVLPKALRNTTVVLPEPEPPWVIVHELGHALDWTIGATHRAEPTTRYAKTNRGEAFAEALCTWLQLPEYRYASRCDLPTIRLFEELSN